MDRDFLIDLFADFGPVTIRKMFSGFGISADGTNFALALRAGLYLPRRRANDPAVRSGGIAAVSVSDAHQDGHRELVLAVAGAPVRRLRGTGRLGEGGAGRGATRGVAQAAEGAQGGEAEGYEGCEQAGCWPQAGGEAARGEAQGSVAPVALRRPGCGSRRRIRDRLRRSRGCGRCAWRRRGRRRRARSANPCHRPVSAWRRRRRW